MPASQCAACQAAALAVSVPPTRHQLARSAAHCCPLHHNRSHMPLALQVPRPALSSYFPKLQMSDSEDGPAGSSEDEQPRINYVELLYQAQMGPHLVRAGSLCAACCWSACLCSSGAPGGLVPWGAEEVPAAPGTSAHSCPRSTSMPCPALAADPAGPAHRADRPGHAVRSESCGLCAATCRPAILRHAAPNVQASHCSQAQDRGAARP